MRHAHHVALAGIAAACSTSGPARRASVRVFVPDGHDVWCWGDNDRGQLGTAPGPKSEPVKVPLPP